MSFDILPTHPENSLPKSTLLDNKSTFLGDRSDKAIVSPIYYTNESVRLESLKEDVSSTLYVVCAFEYYAKSEYSSAINMFKNVKNYEKEKTILFYMEKLLLHAR